MRMLYATCHKATHIVNNSRHRNIITKDTNTHLQIGRVHAARFGYREAKISHGRHPVLVDQHIATLEVAMDHTRHQRVQIVHPACHIGQQGHAPLPRQGCVGIVQDLVQRALMHVSRHHVVRRKRHDTDKVNHVWVIQHRQQRNLMTRQGASINNTQPHPNTNTRSPSTPYLFLEHDQEVLHLKRLKRQLLDSHLAVLPAPTVHPREGALANLVAKI